MNKTASFLIPIIVFIGLGIIFYFISSDEDTNVIPTPVPTANASPSNSAITPVANKPPENQSPENTAFAAPREDIPVPSPNPEIIPMADRTKLREEFDAKMKNMEKESPIKVSMAIHKLVHGKNMDSSKVDKIDEISNNIRMSLKMLFGENYNEELKKPKDIINVFTEFIVKTNGIQYNLYGSNNLTFIDGIETKSVNTLELYLIYLICAQKACPSLAKKLEPIIYNKQQEIAIKYHDADSTFYIDLTKQGEIIDSKADITKNFTEKELKDYKINERKDITWIYSMMLGSISKYYIETRNQEFAIETIWALIRSFESVQEDVEKLYLTMMKLSLQWKKDELAEKFYKISLDKIQDKEKQKEISLNWIQMRESNKQQAISDEWKPLVEKNPKDFLLRLNYARSLTWENKYEQALTNYNAALELASTDEDKAQVYFWMGKLYRLQENNSMAEKYFRKTIDKNRNHYIAKSMLALLLFRKNNYSKEAKDLFEEVQKESNGKSVEAFWGLGQMKKKEIENQVVKKYTKEILEARQKGFEEAIASFQQGLGAAQNQNAQLHYAIGMTQMSIYSEYRSSLQSPIITNIEEHDKYKEFVRQAAEHFKQAVEQENTNPEYHYRFAICVRNVNIQSLELAITHLKKAIELASKNKNSTFNPLLPEAHYNLSTFYFDKSTLKENQDKRKDILLKAQKELDQSKALGYRKILKSYIEALNNAINRTK